MGKFFGGACLTAINVGDSHTCVLLANGSAKCWGNGEDGELGNSLSSSSGYAVDVTATW
jgi:alpha-tubulin suppressor-like RCC1 family protein